MREGLASSRGRLVMDVSRLLSTSKRALMLIKFTVMFPSTYFACGAREFILIQRQHPRPAEVKSFRPRLPHPLNFRVADNPPGTAPNLLRQVYGWRSFQTHTVEVEPRSEAGHESGPIWDRPAERPNGHHERRRHAQGLRIPSGLQLLIQRIV